MEVGVFFLESLRGIICWLHGNGGDICDVWGDHVGGSSAEIMVVVNKVMREENLSSLFAHSYCSNVGNSLGEARRM